MTQPIIAIHGGAGAISRAAMPADKEKEYLDALARIVAAGQAVLAGGGSAIDAVTEAVRLLEDCPLFNAGHGAVFTSAGTHELDAAIMDGATLRSGAIANVDCVRNPVRSRARGHGHSKHVFFVGEGGRPRARARAGAGRSRLFLHRGGASNCCGCSAKRPGRPCWTTTARPW